MKKFIVFFVAASLTSCMVTLPLKWTNEQEAYPGGTTGDNITAGATAYRQSVMNYPFREVFASAEKALSFAQINVTESNESAGLIYGTRSIAGSTRFFYMVKIKEEGADKCNVTVYSKQQQSAPFFKWVPWVVLPSVGLAVIAFTATGNQPGFAIGASLVYPVIFVPLVAYLNSSAKKNSALKWGENDIEYLDRIMAFMRTDLLQK
jgi:hypothetical protein